MKPILSRAEAQSFDALVSGEGRTPLLLLMENAGRGAMDVLLREVPEASSPGARVLVVCGTGNNGGDGFVAARHLRTRGVRVDVVLAGQAEAVKGDARINLEAYVGTGGSFDELPATFDTLDLAAKLARADVIVDALFGTGLTRPLGAAHLALVRRMNESRGAKVSLDLPSGLDADTGAVPAGLAFEAKRTITFGHLKLGLATPTGERYAGRVHVVDLGVPSSLGPGSKPSARLVERRDVAALVSSRPVDVHKHGAGHVAAVGGSFGKVGAPQMVARGALRAGAGLATIVSWEDAYAILQGRVLEEMTAKIARDDIAGSLDAALKGKTALVVGPGLGTDASTRSLVLHLLAHWKGRAVYDADAITALAGEPEAFAKTAMPAVLTPHAGELARLVGSTAKEIEANRFEAAREAAKRARAVVLLKGARTVIASPDGAMVVNASGNAVLATAGAGDTLGGILGAFLCTLQPFEAAYAAAFVHGLAGDAWRDRHGDRGLLAGEIGHEVPRILAALSREHEAAAKEQGTRDRP